VIAVADGVVSETGSDAGQGNYVYLDDTERRQTYVYMHLIEPARAQAGAKVGAGEQLGGVGCTGSCWGDHLHFEIRAGRGIAGEPRDPLPALEDWRALERPR
jgi:murein DD-endopeptidase MepM/ murein hydrolase activator NlpD